MSTQADQAPAVLGPDELQFVEELVKGKIAVQLAGKGYLIESRLSPIARLHNLATLHDVVRQLKLRNNPQLESDVIDAMTTNETSFFRDRHPFEVLQKSIIPEVTKKSGGLTIWNAACSSGQEPLSIAILLNESFPQLVNGKRAQILATDVSPAMVDRTKRAIYSRFEINRGLKTEHATKYFQQQGRDWQAKRELTSLIQVRQLNLIEAWSGLPRCDIVMIRNVLIYFAPDVKRKILQRIATQVLKPGGYLFLGASESPADMDRDFELVTIDGTRLFRTKHGG